MGTNHRGLNFEPGRKGKCCSRWRTRWRSRAPLNWMNGHDDVGAYLLKHGRLALRLQSCLTGICCFQHPSGKIGFAHEILWITISAILAKFTCKFAWLAPKTSALCRYIFFFLLPQWHLKMTPTHSWQQLALFIPMNHVNKVEMIKIIKKNQTLPLSTACVGVWLKMRWQFL